jgi:phage terminase large subunit
MAEINIETPAVFAPLLEPSRYKGAYGGRGSGKSHFFAELLCEDHLINRGMRSVCIREVQKNLKESAKRLLETKLNNLGLSESQGFKVFNEVIQTPGEGLIMFQGMQDHNSESIKSLEGCSRAWIEEAQTLSSRSLSLLRPTIRAPGSEIWASWNPRRKTDPIDVMLRGDELPTGAIVVKSNWDNNPYFPAELEQERLDCLRMEPDQYGHIWEGEYITVASGAYYAKHLAEARQQNRICRLGSDPLMKIWAYFDIGGSGSKADACAIWIVQFVGKEIRFLDYYEAQGQELGYHLTWLRSNGYDKAEVVLPHDGRQADKVFSVSYESEIKKAGFSVRVIDNQGAGAAMGRIEASRKMFNQMWFDSEKCEGGLDALGWYHEKMDTTRNIGLGPCHDWSSHANDAFGMVAVSVDILNKQRTISRRVSVNNGWMG